MQGELECWVLRDRVQKGFVAVIESLFENVAEVPHGLVAVYCEKEPKRVHARLPAPALRRASFR